jgi:uncharacterized protein involved in exopolysaccharide biosynthesis
MNNTEDKYDDEINLFELIGLLWANKIKIILISLLFSIFSVVYAKSIPNTYKSVAVLSPMSSSGNDLSSLASQYSGLSNLAGISLPSGKVDKVGMAVATMQSLSFFEDIASKENIFFLLQAPMDWDLLSNSLIINPNVYDTANNKWVSEANFSINGKPSIQSAHRDFLQNLSVNTSAKTKFITISYEHYSPYVAQKVVELLINEINEMARLEEILIAQNSILFLNQEIKQTELNDLRIKINGLISKQVERITIAQASPEFIVKILSEPIVPELKSGPNKMLIVFMISLFGLIFAIIYSLALPFMKQVYFKNIKK